MLERGESPPPDGPLWRETTMPADQHSLTLDQDEGGWDMGECACGRWSCPPVPGADIVADVYAEHVVAANAQAEEAADG